MAWLDRLRPGLRPGRKSRRTTPSALKGGLEFITPSVISGWAYHPGVPLQEVCLCIGPNRIAAAPIDVHRADVEQHLGVSGRFAFDLRIAADLPLLDLGGEARVVAIAADGIQSWPLQLMRQPEATALRLQVALRQEFRGLRGHFDGLSPEGQSLHGWCYRLGSSGHSQLWLQVEGLPPRLLTADQLRPGFSQAGHPERCGFRFWLKDWPEAAGRETWTSFDREGKLPLPQVGSVQLPLQASPPPITLAPPTASEPAPESPPLAYPTAPDRSPQTVVSYGTPQASGRSLGNQLQGHWQSLEEFRQLIDQLEGELDQPLPPAGNPQPPLPNSRRSARFRLWR